MSQYKGKFKCTILSPKRLIFEKEVNSVFLQGNDGEYELLAYHYPLLGALKDGEVILDWEEGIPIRKGIVRFFANECIILVEEAMTKARTKK